MKNIITQKIYDIYHSLSAGERKVADYILNNLSQIPRMTTLQIKKAACASEPTIFRLCRAMGYSGISELKLAIAETHVSTLPEAAFSEETAGLQGFISRSLLTESRIITTTLNFLDYKLLEKSANQLICARRVCFFGIASSNLVCQDAQRKLQAANINAWAFSLDVDANVLIKQMVKDDVVFCVSHSGHTASVVSVIKYAHELGVHTHLMSAFPASPCAKYAEICLKTYAPEVAEHRHALTSRISQFAMFDALYAMIVATQKPIIRSYIDQANYDMFNLNTDP